MQTISEGMQNYGQSGEIYNISINIIYWCNNTLIVVLIFLMYMIFFIW
jgi:hypothetical protein